MSAPVFPIPLNPADRHAQARSLHNRALAAKLRASVAEAAA